MAENKRRVVGGSNQVPTEELRGQVYRVIRAIPGIVFTSLLFRVQGEYREVDRALQALRKQGRIAYSRKGGWMVTP